MINRETIGSLASFYQQVSDCAGLPRVVSQASLARALARAGLTPDELTPSTLPLALESIYSTLLVYHPQEEALRRRELLRALGEEAVRATKRA